MLEAVTHRSCVEPPDDTCDVCGLLFFPTWAFFMPGNFWTARCSYINKLVHPLDFESKKQEVSSFLDQLKGEKLLDSIIFPDREDTRGLKRYAAGMSS